MTAEDRREARFRLAAMLRRLIANPRDGDAAWDAAEIAISDGLEEEALPAVGRSVALIASNAGLWQMLGLIHRGLGETSAALEAFRKAQTLTPANPKISHAIAVASLEAGLPAVDLYDQAIRLSPADPEAHLGRVGALAAEGAIDKAVSDLAALLRSNPRWIAGHHAFAKLSAMAGNRSSSIETVDAALEAHPADPALHETKLLILSRSGNPDAQRAALADARTRAGRLLSFAKVEAAFLSEQGRIEEADRSFAAIPQDGDESFDLARTRHELRAQRPEQVDRLAEALVNSGEAVTAWAYRSTAWRMMNDPRLAWLEPEEVVGVYDMADALPPMDRLAEVLRQIHFGRSQPLDQSVRGGTQTDGPLFARIEPEIRAVRDAVREAVRRHVEKLPPPDRDHPLLSAPRNGGGVRFSGSWSVRLQREGRHVNHVHTHAWLSSALYVGIPEPSRSTDIGLLQLGAPPDELGLALLPLRTIVPKPGRLVLFPATMWHGTTALTEGERLTIAVDVARPRG